MRPLPSQLADTVDVTAPGTTAKTSGDGTTTVAAPYTAVESKGNVTTVDNAFAQVKKAPSGATSVVVSWTRERAMRLALPVSVRASLCNWGRSGPSQFNNSPGSSCWLLVGCKSAANFSIKSYVPSAACGCMCA